MDEEILRILQVIAKRLDRIQKTMEQIERNTRQMPMAG